MKKFNSIYALLFSLDHESEDGSDITAERFRDAVLEQIEGLRLSEGYWELVTEGPFDTINLEEEIK